MLRKIVLAALAFGLVVPLASAAATDVPSEVNLHNGYVIIRNNLHYINHGVSLDVSERQNGHLMMYHKVGPGGYAIANTCCILAGTRNEVLVNGGFNPGFPASATLAFVPRLCNISGIPFVYADIEITGTYRYVPAATKGGRGHWETEHYSVHRADTKCPE